MKREDAIERIKKLMAITHESGATDSEVFTAITMADKLRIKYKIEKNEIPSNSDSDEIEESEPLEVKYGYYVYPILTLAKHFRCNTLIVGRLNGSDVLLYACGFKEDVELFIPVAKAMIKYLDQTLFDKSTQYPFKKQKYSYLIGFADGLRSALEESLKELNLEKKYELAVVGVPAVVEEFSLKNATRASMTNWDDIDYFTYAMGYTKGLNYKI